jgi:hypothetical protein
MISHSQARSASISASPPPRPRPPAESIVLVLRQLDKVTGKGADATAIAAQVYALRDLLRRDGRTLSDLGTAAVRQGLDHDVVLEAGTALSPVAIGAAIKRYGAHPAFSPTASWTADCLRRLRSGLEPTRDDHRAWRDLQARLRTNAGEQ